MTKTKDTVKQHYIPQVYLRGFSPEYEKAKRKEIDKRRCTIYLYDLSDGQRNNEEIKDICYEDYLYEVTGNNGEYVVFNHLEKILGFFEQKFSDFRRKLEAKVFYEENYKTGSFLTREEKDFWIVYIAIQLLRSPSILRSAEEFNKEFFGEKVSDAQARNISRLFCLPFFKEIDENSEEAFVFQAIVEPMMKMSFAVGVDRKGSIITSDETMYIYSSEIPCQEYGKVIFPITANICLILLGGEEKRKHKRRNFLFPISDEKRDEIFWSIVYSARERIYANHPLDKHERLLVKKALKDRESEV